MKNKNHIIGLQWNDDALRLAEGDRVFIEPWPAEAPTAYARGPRDVAHFFKTIAAKRALKGRSVVVSLPRHRYFAHTLSREEIAAPNLAEVAQKWFPLPLEQLLWRGDTEPAAMIAAISKEWEREFVGSFKSAGFELLGIASENELAATQLVQSHLTGTGFWFCTHRNDWANTVEIATRRHANVFAVAAMTLVGLGIFLGARAEQNKLAVAEVVRRARVLNRPVSGQSMATLSSQRLVDILAQVPARCYLIDLSFDAQQNNLSLHGRADTYPTVTAFTSALTALAGLKKVENHKSALIDLGGRSVVDFSFTVPL